MKKILIMALLALGLPYSAFATHMVNLSGEADCDLWLASFEMIWRYDAHLSDTTFDYFVVIRDEEGFEVVTYEAFVDLVPETYIRSTLHQIGEAWDIPLTGTFTVTGILHWYAPYGDDGLVEQGTETFSSTFTCEAPVNPCHFTPGFWKNHPNEWPIDTLVLGNVNYTKEDALAVLNTPVRGDASVILGYHLIAAKLNLANAADPGIVDTVYEADVLLEGIGGIGSRPLRAERESALLLKEILVDYNEMGCIEGMVEEEKNFQPWDESATLDGLKSMYR